MTKHDATQNEESFQVLWAAMVDAHFALGAWKENDGDPWQAAQDRANRADEALLRHIHSVSGGRTPLNPMVPE